MNYTDWKQMTKQAALPLLGIGGKVLGAMGATSDTARFIAVTTLAAAAGIGGAGGWLAAKLNAHDKQDIDTIQKEYENERLKADLGYLSSKTKYEYDALKNKKAPTAARVIA